ncbi:MAG: multicopper oxidase family protein [bacterium]|nr:multicopper oxidase family protein [bacterium]
MKKRYILFGVILLPIIILSGISSEISEKEFSTSTWGLPEAQLSQIVELKDGDTYDLTASFVKKNINGNAVRMLAYNGSVPGPTLKVPQGATVKINFKNDTDIGNTLHSHGVRMENASDGVPDVTQEIVPVGGSFAYVLKFPDAGAYWYHPHVRDDYTIEMGLYGNFLVTPKEGSSWNKVDREEMVFIDDILLEKGDIAPFKKEGADRTLMGRYGNTMFVNGETDYTLSVKKGEVVRFYFTNSANVRPFNLTIVGTKMKLVGGDSGLYERDTWADSVMINPSERAIVEVLFDKEGSYELQNKTSEKTYTLGGIVVSGGETSLAPGKSFSDLRLHPEISKSIDQFRSSFTKKVDKQMKLSIYMMGGSNMGGMMTGGAMMEGGMGSSTGVPKGGIEWEDTDMSAMNMMSDTKMIAWNIVDEDSGKKNMDIDWDFKVGDKVKIRITNDGTSMPARMTEGIQSGGHPMQHPIHFHGQRFLVVNKNGVQQTNLVWKDTVLVLAGEYVDIILDASNKGTWMAHCHIAEHLEAGMMMTFKVE